MPICEKRHSKTVKSVSTKSAAAHGVHLALGAGLTAWGLDRAIVNNRTFRCPRVWSPMFFTASGCIIEGIFSFSSHDPRGQGLLPGIVSLRRPPPLEKILCVRTSVSRLSDAFRQRCDVNKRGRGQIERTGCKRRVVVHGNT